MQELFFILLLATSIALWVTIRRRSDLARRTCKLVCQQAGLILLDDSVAFRRQFLHQGKLVRSYSFEWTRDGQTRKRGSLWLDGEHVEFLNFEDGQQSTLVSAPQ
jgi:hypothetical protein